jgi:hypothetical protein
MRTFCTYTTEITDSNALKQIPFSWRQGITYQVLVSSTWEITRFFAIPQSGVTSTRLALVKRASIEEARFGRIV